jgi:ketosteroid isomerase-like protein
MRKYLYALVLLLLALDLPIFAQCTKSDGRVFESHTGPIVHSAGSPEEALIGLEHRFWGARKRKDITAINELVAEDAQFVDEDNVVSKEEFTRAISTYTPTSYTLSGIKARAITAEVCIVNYKVKVKFTTNSTKLPVMSALVTSVWSNQDGKWQLKHHHFGLMPVTKADP